jgi:hypothetical protein
MTKRHHTHTQVVITGLFFSFFASQTLHNRKTKSGDVNYEANLPFFFCFIRELNLILSPYLLPHFPRELKPYTPPPYLLPHFPRELKPYTPPLRPFVTISIVSSAVFSDISRNYSWCFVCACISDDCSIAGVLFFYLCLYQ